MDPEYHLKRLFYINTALLYETLVELSNQKIDLLSIKNVS